MKIKVLPKTRFTSVSDSAPTTVGLSCIIYIRHPLILFLFCHLLQELFTLRCANRDNFLSAHATLVLRQSHRIAITVSLQLRNACGNQNEWIFGKVPNGLWPLPTSFSENHVHNSCFQTISRVRDFSCKLRVSLQTFFKKKYNQRCYSSHISLSFTNIVVRTS